jgi:hypothetical protein
MEVAVGEDNAMDFRIFVVTDIHRVVNRTLAALMGEVEVSVLSAGRIATVLRVGLVKVERAIQRQF